MRPTNLRTELAQFVNDQQSLQAAISSTPKYHHVALNESEATNSGAAMTKVIVRSNPTAVNLADGKRYALSTRSIGLLHGNPMASDETQQKPSQPIPYTVVKKGNQLYFVDTTTYHSNTFSAFLRFNAAPVKNPHNMQTLIVLWRHAQYDLLNKIHDVSTHYVIDARTLKVALTDAFGERCANAIIKHTQYESDHPNTQKPIIALQPYHLTLAAYAEEIVSTIKTAEQLAMAQKHILAIFPHMNKLTPHNTALTPNDILIKLKNPNGLVDKMLLMQEPDIDSIIVAEPNMLVYALYRSQHSMANTPYPHEENHPLIEEVFRKIRQLEAQFEAEKKECKNRESQFEIESMERQKIEKQLVAEATQLHEKQETQKELIQSIQAAILEREKNRTPHCCFFSSQLQQFTETFQQQCNQGTPEKALSFFKDNLTLFTERSARIFEKHKLIEIDRSTGARSLAPNLNRVLQ